MFRSSEPKCVWNARAKLGEGVWWSSRNQAVYWLDIKRPAVMRYVPQTRERKIWIMPEYIGCFAPTISDDFIVAFASGIYRMQLHTDGTHSRTIVAIPDEFSSGMRFNDGYVDPGGAFWAGTMDDAESDKVGWYYKLTSNSELIPILGPFTICNGPAFSSDGRYAYVSDSANRKIFRLDLNLQAPELFHQLSESEGYPDGLAVDSLGYIWAACWDGWKIIRLSPNGERVHELTMPVSRPTKCAFGGARLNTMYVSSASTGLNHADLTKQPLAGGLFEIELTNIKGISMPLFKG